MGFDGLVCAKAIKIFLMCFLFFISYSIFQKVDLLDLSTVDVILISNSFFSFALPFITEVLYD